MHDFLRNQNYSGRQFSGETQNARLALHIALYLRATQQRSGNWAPTHQGRSLRYTCHALEALHLLGLPAFHRLLDRGQNWLMNLSEEIDEESEEWTSIRLHPSRFKTLARLARFDDPQVRAEFDELCARINNQGLLNNVIQDPLLGSIIVCDCLLDLQQQNRLPASGLALLETTLPAVNDALVSWCDAPDPRDRNRLLGDISDASYALDVLLRAAYAGPAPALTDVVRRQMLSTLAAQQTTGPLAKDAIYSAIQLGTHFFHDAEVHTALDPFLEGLRVRYDRGQVQERNDDLHPLILRALVTCGGQPLREQIVGLLLDNAFNTLSQNQQQRDVARNARFEQLIRKRAQITISKVVELTGGITDARIFRVHYALEGSGLTDHTEAGRQRLAPTYSVVVKSGARADLIESVSRYQDLRSDLQPYFAQHAHQPELLEASAAAPAYLILEDLTEEYSTFRQVLETHDRLHLSDEARETLAKATATIFAGLADIYRKTRRRESELVGLQVSRLYLSRLDRALIEMSRPEKFPRLKDFFRGFWLDNRRFASIETYQSHLYHHRDRLRPPCLMLMHGDCHSRNIMLDVCYEKIKLIDLDRLDPYGDYALDVALLIEDVALFRRLFDTNYRYYLRPEQVQMAADSTRIEYPPFLSEAGVLFQQRLLEQTDAFARELGDTHYCARLWLGIALYLLRLVEKQDDLRLGAVLYVEAVKLLDTLVQHLEGHQPLPPMPIMREHPQPADVARLGDGTQPVDQEIGLLHDLLLELQPSSPLPISHQVRLDGKSVRYFLGEADEPFAILDGKRRPPSFLLSCPAGALPEMPEYVQPIQSAGTFGVALRLPETYDAASVRMLLQKALAFAVTAAQTQR